MSLGLKTISAENLFEMGDIGRCELVRGEIIMMAPAGAEHGNIAGEIFGRIWSFVTEHKLGKMYAAETGFIIARNPDTTRAADVAFVRRDRIPAGRLRGFFPGPPDFVVEVVSPNDRLPEVLMKVNEWISAGTVSVWVVNPQRKTIEIHSSGGKVVQHRDSDEINDDPILLGFSLKLRDIFDA